MKMMKHNPMKKLLSLLKYINFKLLINLALLHYKNKVGFNMSEKSSKRYETYSESKSTIFHNFYKTITLNARKEFFNLFVLNTKYSENKSVIDIGTTPSLEEEQNIFLEKTKNNTNITCLSNQDCQILFKKYKNIKKIIISAGRNTKIENNSFDIVHSNATIEHVGSLDNQLSFRKECFEFQKR